MLRTRPGSRPAGPLAIAGPPFLLGVPVPLSPCFPSSLSSRAVSSPGRPPVLPTLPGRPVSSPLWSFPSPLVLIPAPLLCAVSHLTHRPRVRGQRARLWALRRVRVPVSRCSVAVGRRVQCYFPGFSPVQDWSPSSFSFIPPQYRCQSITAPSTLILRILLFALYSEH